MKQPRWPPPRCPARPGRRRRRRLRSRPRGRGHRHPHLRAGPCSRRTASSPGMPNVNETTRRVGCSRSSFPAKPIVVRRGSPDRQAAGGRPPRDLGDVVRVRLRVGRRRRTAEHVDAERPRGQRPELGDLLGQGLRRQVPGCQEPERVRRGHPGHQPRRRGAAGQRCEHDRQRHPVEHHGPHPRPAGGAAPAPSSAPVGGGVQLLKQPVGGPLDLLVPPLGGTVDAGDQAASVQAAKVAADERVARPRLLPRALT